MWIDSLPHWSGVAVMSGVPGSTDPHMTTPTVAPATAAATAGDPNASTIAGTGPAGASPGGPARGAVVFNFAVVYLIWGSTYLAIRYVLETLPPLLSGGARFVLAGAVLLALAAFNDRRRGVAGEPLTRTQWGLATVVGGLLFLGGNGAVMWAEQRVASGIAALLVAIMPLWLVLLEWARPGGHRPTLVTSLGLLLGTAGLALLVGKPSDAGSVDIAGVIVLLLGSLLWAAGSLVARSPRLPRNALRNAGMQMLTGGALLLVAGTIGGEWSRLDLAGVSRASWLGWLYLVTFGSLLGFTSFAWLMRKVAAAKVATYAYVNPVIAVFLGWLVASEPVTPRMLAAAAVIVAAVVMITVEKTKR